MISSCISDDISPQKEILNFDYSHSNAEGNGLVGRA